MAESFRKFKEQADELGLTGAEKKDYIVQQQAAETQRLQEEQRLQRLLSDERREAKKLEVEAEKERAAAEFKTAELQAQTERAAAELQAQTAAAALQAQAEKDKEDKLFELEKMRLGLEQSRAKAASEQDAIRLRLDHEGQLKINEAENILKLRTIEHENNKLVEMERLRLASVSASSHSVSDREDNPSIETFQRRLNLPPLKSSDRVEVLAYFEGFKKRCELLKIPEVYWGILLSTRIQGELLEMYNRIPSEKSGDYGEIEKTILKKYLVTADFFKDKFRSYRQSTGDTTMEYFAKLQSYVHRWLELSKVEKTYAAVCDFLVQDQYYFKLGQHDNARLLFIKGKEPKNLAEIARYSDLFEEIQGTQRKTGVSHGQNQNLNTNLGPRRVENKVERVNPSNSFVGARSSNSGRSTPQPCSMKPANRNPSHVTPSLPR